MKIGWLMAWLDRFRRRLLCLVGLHDWSEPLPFRDELYKHSTRRRRDYQRFCWRIDIGCSVRRPLRHIATFTPEQRRNRRRWRL